MKHRWAALLLALVFLPLSAALAQDADMDAAVDAAFARAKAVGGAVVVAMGQEIVYERYYGEQQKTTHVPVSEHSYFRIASVTKLVTGIGLLQLMEQGVLDPDEDISTYLGYTVRNPRYPDDPITLRQLMSHTAGLNENSSYTNRARTLREMIDVTQKARANFKDVRPGTVYEYSNFGAGITGSIIEAVTGQDVSGYMREAVFAPLGIDAAYTVTQLQSPEDITASYKKDGSLTVSPSYLLRQPYEAAADPDTHYRLTVGSLFIRPRDLAKLGIALCGDGTVEGVRVLSEASVAMTRQEQSPETTGITAKSPYSFFVIRQDTLLKGRRVYGHQGTSEGIVCNLYVEPESGLTLVVMSNGCNAVRDDGIMSLTRRIAGIVEEAYLQ